jgi:ribosomal protein L24
MDNTTSNNYVNDGDAIDQLVITEISARVHVPGEAFGAGFRGNVTIERRCAFPRPVTVGDARVAEQMLVEGIVADISGYVQTAVETVTLTASTMPRANTAGAYAQAVPVNQAPVQAAPANLPVASATTPAGIQALAGGQAQPDGGLVSVQGRYGAVTFPHPNEITTDQIKAAALQVLETEHYIHPSQVAIFDNRNDLIGGTDRSGHLGRVILSRNCTAPNAMQVIGKQSIAWVDWDARSSSVRVRLTKETQGLAMPIRQELAQPAAAGGNPF